jgi:hypothetical protein
LNNEESTERTECACHGWIATCLYCEGTGFVAESKKTQAETILANSRVLQCAACGQQNRLMKERLQQVETLLCLRCYEPLLRPVASLFSLMRKPS